MEIKTIKMAAVFSTYLSVKANSNFKEKLFNIMKRLYYG